MDGFDTDMETFHFNSRPSARGDQPPKGGDHDRPDFNSRPSARGDVERKGEKDIIHQFQFTPLREGRLVGRNTDRICMISIHAPPRGATCFGMALHSRFVFQFTPLREGRPRSATRWHRRILFQFTPLREGRRFKYFAFLRKKYFNSRPSARGDGGAFRHDDWSERISIHAPPRGATQRQN